MKFLLFFPQLSSVGVFSSSLGSFLGFLPTQLLYCYLGSTVHNMQELLDDRLNTYIILIVQVIASILLVYYVVRKARIEFAKLAAEQELKAKHVGSLLQTEEKLKVPRDIESGIS